MLLMSFSKSIPGGAFNRPMETFGYGTDVPVEFIVCECTLNAIKINFIWVQTKPKYMTKCVCVCVATTWGHVEERKQEMPDVHQLDLSVAGEHMSDWGVPPLLSHDLSAL